MGCKKRSTLLAVCLTLIAATIARGETLRVVDYNITSSGGTPRTGLDTILQAIGNESVAGHAQPLDILAMEEVQSQSTTGQSVVNLLNGIYGAGTYGRGALNGSSTGSGTQGVVFNTHTLSLVGEAAIGVASTSGQPRQAMRYEFEPVGGTSADDFYVYVSHYKAGDTSSDQVRRQPEALAIRTDADSLGANARIIYAGDYNIQSSSETSYQTLLAVGNGQAKDPLNQSGTWHNNNSFLSILTQAPANSPPSGLTGGGLDDRFDFQLVSDDVLNPSTALTYVSSTYHTFGNNGSVPLNGDINASSSTALSGLANRTQVLNLLTTVSDHLPVVAEYSIAVPEPACCLQLLLAGTVIVRRRSRHKHS